MGRLGYCHRSRCPRCKDKWSAYVFPISPRWEIELEELECSICGYRGTRNMYRHDAWTECEDSRPWQPIFKPKIELSTLGGIIALIILIATLIFELVR